jgi:ABC-type branched-subunit amino acid transport system substrate-binding protein
MNGESMRIRQGIKAGLVAIQTSRKGALARLLASAGACAVIAVGAVGIVPSTTATAAVRPLAATSAACAAATGSPGITKTTINTGAMSTLTGPIASNFESLVPGIQAYYDYVNAHGGVDGRKIELTYNTDDTGNPSQDTALEHTLVDQDHVFAVAGVATAFFTPTYFVQTCTPTFGYNVTGNWNGPENLFAAGGSVQDNAAGDPAWIYLAKQVEKTPSVGVLAYNIASSNGSCNQAIAAFKQAGIKVSYQDTSISYGASVIPDTERMKAAGTNFILSCMDVTGNISLARGVKQYGIPAKQLWLNGNDPSTLNQYQDLMQGVYFNIQHVPFEAPLSKFPGLAQYVAAMKKYEPKYLYDEVGLQGWQSAALLVAGLKAAGPNPTQLGVINAINKMTNESANGLTTPVNWSPGGGGHTYPITNNTCSAFIQVQGDKYVTVVAKKPQVFVCFRLAGSILNGSGASPGNSYTHAVPITPPAGTPAPVG